MLKVEIAIVAAAVALSSVACKEKNAPPSPAASSASSVASAASAAPDAATDAPKPPPFAERRYVKPKGCPSAPEAIATARAFAAETDWRDARDAYVDAIRAKPFDANLRIDYAHAAAEIDDAREAQYQFLLAILMTKDGAVRGRAWLELGLHFEKRGISPELARASFATAERYGAKGAKEKIGAQSHCPALWSTAHDPAINGEITLGYGETSKSGDMTIRTRRGGFVMPFATVNPGKIGGAGVEDFVTGSFIWNGDANVPPCKLDLTGMQDLPRATRARPGEKPMAMDGAPQPYDPPTTLTRWSVTKNDKFLFTLTALFADVSATIANGKAHIVGQGCDVDVVLP